MLVMKGDGMRACRFDGRAYFLTDGIEVDERTFRGAEGVALLHRSDTLVVSLHIYRTTAAAGVMVFPKTLSVSRQGCAMRADGRVRLAV